MTGSTTYRRAQTADVPFIRALDRISYPTSWRRERIWAELHQWHGAGWIVEYAGQPAGYVVYHQLPRSLDVVRLAVDPRYRRRYLGSGILRRLTAKLGDGRNTMRLWLDIDNIEAMGCAAAAGLQLRVLRGSGGVMAWCGRPCQVMRRSCR